jgi:hypothetical protein
MRCLVTLPHFNPRYASCGSYIAARIAAWSTSAFNGLLVASLIFAMCAAPSASAYGAGGSRRPATPVQGSSSRKAVIEVRTSPVVYLPGPTFSTQVTSQKPVTPRVPELLQQIIEQTLLRNDPRLKVAATAADTSIVCTITDLAVQPGVETRTRQEYQKTGEIMVTDPTTGVSRMEDQYGYVDMPYRALVFEGRMSVKCEVTDVATGILLYSDRFDALYTDAREVGAGPGTHSVDGLNFVYLKLADNAAGLILAQLSPRVYPEIVALPSGKLTEASKLMESGPWSEALILLSRMPAFKDPKDEAYRFYSIGVAHEALAYKALNAFEKKLKLERAVDNYRRAAELKPSEDMFWAPMYRAEFVLWQTTGLVAQVEVFEEAKRPGSKAATSPGRIAAGNTDLFRQTRSRVRSGPLLINNQTVVEWVKSGRSSDYITASIKHAPRTHFDLSAAEELKLRRDGVSNRVLKAMAQSQQGLRPRIGGRTRAVFTVLPLLWWLPLLFGR